jgi:hypothetical protein
MKIPAFSEPKETKNYFWQKVKINFLAENIPVHRLDEIAKAHCQYLEILQNSMFLTCTSEDEAGIMWLWFAVKKDKYMKLVERKILGAKRKK